MSASLPARIRVLMLEDSPADAELMVAELRARLDPEWRRVQTEAEYLDFLGPEVDVILADYNMPGFDAGRALELLQQRELDIPFIIVSGTISEETAVECMKRGAADYLFKDRLARLGPAVIQALEQRRLRDEKRKVDAALRESEERYRLITETINDGIVLTDLDGRILLSNRSIREITGYTREELAGRPIFSLLAPEDSRQAAARLAMVQAGQDASPLFETEMVGKDGRRVWLEAQMTSVVSDGVVVGRLGAVRDISARKRAEATLRDSEARYRAVTNSAHDSIVTVNDAGAIVGWNRGAEMMFGYADAEVIGQPLTLLMPHQYRDRHREGINRAHASKEAQIVGKTVTVEGLRKDGSAFPLELSMAAWETPEGRFFTGIIRDITERRRAAERLQQQREALYQSEKLAAMGQLLAGVAHELNNPLSVVMGQSALLREAAPPALAERARKIVAAADRCARIVRNFLALARQHPAQRQEVGLNNLVREAVELLAYPLRVDSVEVVLDLASDVPALWGDTDQLHQVLVNLISNAHQALRGSASPSRITITTRRTAGGVTLEVEDTGPGIPAEIRSRIFEPFFTTKPPGQGTGLGLPLCQGIVEDHCGRIQVESVPGRGATFRVELPLGEPPALTAEAPREVAPRARPCVILVVDDEPGVAEVFGEILREDGHQVDTAANGLAALEKLGHRSYDAVLCDMRMPELDGPGLYRRVQENWPELVNHWIFLTGDALGSETRDFLQRAHAPMLMKPFPAEDLRRSVAKVTARR